MFSSYFFTYTSRILCTIDSYRSFLRFSLHTIFNTDLFLLGHFSLSVANRTLSVRVHQVLHENKGYFNTLINNNFLIENHSGLVLPVVSNTLSSNLSLPIISNIIFYSINFDMISLPQDIVVLTKRVKSTSFYDFCRPFTGISKKMNY